MVVGAEDRRAPVARVLVQPSDPGAPDHPGRRGRGDSRAPGAAGRERCAARSAARAAPRSRTPPPPAAASPLGAAAPEVEVGAQDHGGSSSSASRCAVWSPRPAAPSHLWPAGPAGRRWALTSRMVRPESVVAAPTATRRWRTSGNSTAPTGPSGSGVRIALPRSLRSAPFRMLGTYRRFQPRPRATSTISCYRSGACDQLARGESIGSLGNAGVPAEGFLEEEDGRQVAGNPEIAVPKARDHLVQPAASDPDIPAHHHEAVATSTAPAVRDRGRQARPRSRASPRRGLRDRSAGKSLPRTYREPAPVSRDNCHPSRLEEAWSGCIFHRSAGALPAARRQIPRSGEA